MRKPTFILDKPKSDGLTYIFLLITCADGRLKFSTREKVIPAHFIGQRCILPKSTKDKELSERYEMANIVLGNFQNKIKELSDGSKLTGEPVTKDQLIIHLGKLVGVQNSAKTAKSNFHQVINEIIFEREHGRVLTKQMQQFSTETIRHYKHTRDNLIKYEEGTGTRLSFQTFNEQVYNDIIRYFNDVHDHSVNSLGKIIKNLKVFMKTAYNKGYHKNICFNDDWFVTPEEQTPDIYLTIAELEAMEKHKLHKKDQQICRDWFIVGSWLGLRVSDLLRLNETDNLQKDFITISNEKTNEKIVVPIHPMARRVLKRWKGFPPKVSSVELNRVIKEVAELAKINQKILFTITKGGQRVDEYLPKWKMVSSHTMRRNFITNTLLAGFMDNQVMSASGIKKHTTLLRYKKASPEDVAKEMSKHPLFK
jgi:integrase